MCWLPSLKRLDLKVDLYTILQVLSLSLFEKLSLKQILIGEDYTPQQLQRSIQLNLFDYLTGHYWSMIPFLNNLRPVPDRAEEARQIFLHIHG